MLHSRKRGHLALLLLPLLLLIGVAGRFAHCWITASATPHTCCRRAATAGAVRHTMHLHL
jgi:hypothetical protein